MKNLFAFGLFCTLTITACKKDKGIAEEENSQTPTPIPSAFMPFKVGNYWIYQSVKIDTNGNETINPTLDSVHVQKDTVINGQTFYEIRGRTWWNDPAYVEYLRDSSGFIVAPSGRKYFAPFYDNYLLSFDTTANYSGIHLYMTSGNTSVTVPAGTFTTAVKTQKTFFYPSYQWGNPRYNYAHYCNGIGIIKEQKYYDATPDTYEGRLVRYHVQ